ncbi:saccharopine dehydrogenase NADP-binding domain-containing protein [Nonomuraea fastidiosa]|uniref:saccharopine dehydrogenase NADP-binding domain-containing protein n=1 Tax=Nonomuraea fastidiosa TaxID=46173 RepID=UPI00366EF22A
MKITVYGASGYQGRLVLAELARRGIEPILAGRDPARLTQAAEATGLHGAQRRQAAAGDHRALARAFTGSDAVINCAGPFTFTARAVAAAAIDAGCHYVDTCGEQLAIKDLFDTLASRARGAGVSVVPAATDGCVLLDLLASLVAARLDRIGEMRTVHLIGPGGASRAARCARWPRRSRPSDRAAWSTTAASGVLHRPAAAVRCGCRGGRRCCRLRGSRCRRW